MCFQYLGEMPDFYFHIRNGQMDIQDPDATSFANLAEAHLDAVAAIREIVANKIRFGEAINGYQLDICDSLGNVLETILFRAVLKSLG